MNRELDVATFDKFLLWNLDLTNLHTTKSLV